MDPLHIAAANAWQSQRSIRQLPRSAYFLASCGLLVVSTFCFAGHPASPLRVSQRSSHLANHVDIRLAVGDIVTQESGSLPLAENSPPQGSDLGPLKRSTSIIGGYLSAPVEFLQNAIKSGWYWATSRSKSQTYAQPDEVSGATENSDSATKTAGMAQESLKHSLVVESYDGQELVSSAMGIGEVAGVALLFHGCGENARDWYELPEHRRIVKQLHDAQIHTVAFSAARVASNCWSTRFPPEKNEDVRHVRRAFQSFMRNQSRLSDLPRYGVGVSSGGSFLSILSGYAAMPNFASQVLYLSNGNMRAFRKALPEYPNTLFVHLRASDSFPSRQALKDAKRALLHRGVRLVGEMSQRPTPLRPLTLHARDPRLSQSSSEHVFKMLLKCRLHFRGNQDGTEEKCRYTDILRQNKQDQLLQRLLSSDVASRSLTQMIRVISGGHEISSSSSDKVIKWLVSNARH